MVDWHSDQLPRHVALARKWAEAQRTGWDDLSTKELSNALYQAGRDMADVEDERDELRAENERLREFAQVVRDSVNGDPLCWIESPKEVLAALEAAIKPADGEEGSDD